MTNSSTMLHGMTPDDVRRLVADTIAETITPTFAAIEQKVSAPHPEPDQFGTRDMLSAQEIAD